MQKKQKLRPLVVTKLVCVRFQKHSCSLISTAFGSVQPFCWITIPANQMPERTQCSNGSFLIYWARKAPTNASPAPFVSTILSLGTLGTSKNCTVSSIKNQKVTCGSRTGLTIAFISLTVIRLFCGVFWKHDKFFLIFKFAVIFSKLWKMGVF